ncbi:adenosine receptor A2b-like [Gigantopelta aegis]|uniref:adenosine receptor A2b-like n=1 Tax=Gigantopelta aegis TaxID=1735272 RepID=UPI001B88D317|nr:adenosine receptor A2b-like [Gigantopelta aegis]
MVNVIISAILILIIISGNILTIVAVARTHSLRTIPNMYVVSLAVADCMTGFGLADNIIFFVIDTPKSKIHFLLCIWLSFVTLVPMGVSVTTMALIAFDRYLYIVYPLRYFQMMTGFRARIIITLSWVLMFVINIAPLVQNSYETLYGCVFSNAFPISVTAHYGVAYFIVTSVITVILSSLIIRVAWRQNRAVRGLPGGADLPNGGGIIGANWKFVKLLMMVFGIYFCCWMPSIVSAMLDVSFQRGFAISMAVSPLIFVNAGSNCFVYAWMNREFREAFKGIFKHFCLCQRKCTTQDNSNA